MGLFEKKQELNRGGISPREKPLTPKEEKSDISRFGGKPYISQEKGRGWVRNPKLFETTRIPEKERRELWDKVTKGMGYFIERGEPEKVYNELRKFPTRAKEKYGLKSEGERLKMVKLLKEFLGK